MSDVNNPADELEREEDTAADDAEHNAEAGAQPQADMPEPASEDEIDLPEGTNLIQAIIEAQMEAQSNKDGWQRARAEFANYKKRTERERAAIYQRAAHDTLAGLLPIIDDFERAMGSVPEAIREDAWFEGVAMIQGKFMNLLENQAVEAIDPTGELFDPNWHQAIGAEDSDEVESGHVIETLQKGYRAGDKALRLALVKVAS